MGTASHRLKTRTALNILDKVGSQEIKEDNAGDCICTVRQLRICSMRSQIYSSPQNKSQFLICSMAQNGSHEVEIKAIFYGEGPWMAVDGP